MGVINEEEVRGMLSGTKDKITIVIAVLSAVVGIVIAAFAFIWRKGTESAKKELVGGTTGPPKEPMESAIPDDLPKTIDGGAGDTHSE